ncbi:MAG: hypothetical protein R6U03_12745, partial [Gillisia sp.]
EAPAKVVNKEKAKIQRTLRQAQPVQDQTLNGLEWQESISDSLLKAMEHLNPSADIEELEILQKKILNRGEISRKVLTDFWSKTGKEYGTTRNY